MKGKQCKLYDENIVRNIMVSTGMSVFEFMQKNKAPGEEDICEYVENAASEIIEKTIADMNAFEELPPENEL